MRVQGMSMNMPPGGSVADGYDDKRKEWAGNGGVISGLQAVSKAFKAVVERRSELRWVDSQMVLKSLEAQTAWSLAMGGIRSREEVRWSRWFVVHPTVLPFGGVGCA